MISEQDNSPEAVKGRVSSITKSIRYQAKKEGGNMIKAFNDYLSTSGSGIGAVERQMIKKSLGLSEKFSNWRDDLIEVMGDDEMDVKIKEKKIKNKIKINPEMSEEFQKIGATVVEMLEVIDYDENYKPLEIETIDIIKPEPLNGITEYKHQSGPALPGEPGRSHSAKAPGGKPLLPGEKQTPKLKSSNPKMKMITPQKEEIELDEYASMSPQEVMLQKRKAQLDVMIAKKRKESISKAGQKSDEPTKTESMNEEDYDRMKDRQLERGGMGARQDYTKPAKGVKMGPMSDAEKQKSREASRKAFDKVKKSITDKYGKGALINTKKEENELDEKCWPGYRVNPKRKTKILFGKRYPNCEKAK